MLARMMPGRMMPGRMMPGRMIPDRRSGRAALRPPLMPRRPPWRWRAAACSPRKRPEALTTQRPPGASLPGRLTHAPDQLTAALASAPRPSSPLPPRRPPLAPLPCPPPRAERWPARCARSKRGGLNRGAGFGAASSLGPAGAALRVRAPPPFPPARASPGGRNSASSLLRRSWFAVGPPRPGGSPAPRAARPRPLRGRPGHPPAKPGSFIPCPPRRAGGPTARLTRPPSMRAVGPPAPRLLGRCVASPGLRVSSPPLPGLVWGGLPAG